MSASLREQYGTARAFVLLSAGRARVGVEKALCLGRRFRAGLSSLGSSRLRTNSVPQLTLSAGHASPWSGVNHMALER